MTKKKDRLSGILQIAESKESNAAAIYSKHKQDWAFNQEKLDELRAFRDEYQPPVTAQSANRFQSTRQFLNQLSQAIDQQEQQVEQLLEQVHTTQGHWQGRRQERMSVEKVIEKRGLKQQRDAARYEQKELDELSSRTTQR
ncbi:MAG: flagellar export protein FliJ [Pseudomonadales bacterium]|jgi:flagellar FliJ protein